MDLPTFKVCGPGEIPNADNNGCDTCGTGKITNADKTACDVCGADKITNADKTACESCVAGKAPNSDQTACIQGRKSLTTDEANPEVSKNLEKCQKSHISS